MVIYVITFLICFFLMFLGILRIFEVNDYFGNEQYDLVKIYCEPKGFFGWGYECDNAQYSEDIGYQQFQYLNISFNIT